MAKTQKGSYRSNVVSIAKSDVDARKEGPRQRTWNKAMIAGDLIARNDKQIQVGELFLGGSSVAQLGTAGTGKTTWACLLACVAITEPSMPQKRIIIVRSAVPGRDLGAMPGTEEEKISVYEKPYPPIFQKIFRSPNTWRDMKEEGVVEFMSSSNLRGVTWDNAVVIVDEVQNMTLDEFDTIITRCGKNTLMLLAGDDKHQNDLKMLRQHTGIHIIKEVLARMPNFDTVEFDKHDILRIGLCRDWIFAREELAEESTHR